MKNQPQTNTQVYVLKLAHSCWYVGMSGQLSKRIRHHFSGRDSIRWLQIHEPIDVQLIMDGTMETKSKLTLDLICLYGVNRVRGGAGYSRLGPYRQENVPVVRAKHVTDWFK